MSDKPGKLTWKEEKAYLAGNLFQDVPVSSSSSEDDSLPAAASEPSSLLPPLIVNVVPTPNPNDDLEEFYKELEIKLHKCYRDSDNEDFGLDDDIQEMFKDKYKDSTEPTDDFKHATCISDVHCEDIDTDRPNSVLNEAVDSQSPFLPHSSKKHVQTNKGSVDAGILDVKDDTGIDVGENQDSTHKISTLHPISDYYSSGESVDIMRANNAGRLPTGPAPTIPDERKPASSALPVDFECSDYLDFEIDLYPISSSNNPTKMETTSLDMESKLPTRSTPSNYVDDRKTSRNKAITTQESDQNAENSERNAIPVYRNTNETKRKAPVPATSTPKSKSATTWTVVEEFGSPAGSNVKVRPGPSDATGTKRRLRDLPRECKRRKRIDAGVQTDGDVDRNEVNNYFFIARTGRMYKLCGCVNHRCAR